MTRATSIAGVIAWEALDSRGNPTVGCEVRLRGGACGRAHVPSGASRGRYEVLEQRDGDERYGGLGVRRAVANITRVLGPGVTRMDATDQEAVDGALRDLDGTPDLSRLGGNAILAVSVSVALAGVEAEERPLYRRWLDGEPVLPLPMFNIISGGAHAGGAVDVQDLLVVPLGATSFAQALEWGWRIRRATSEIAAERGLTTALVADEGGLGLSLPSNGAALGLLTSGIERAGFAPGEEAAIAVDVAAGQFASDDGYHLAVEGRTFDTQGFLGEVTRWCDEYPVLSIEDPMHEDDWDGWVDATRRLGGRVQVVGDDLFATNLDRLEDGIAAGAANAVLIKPNQVGTLSDARATLMRAADAGYGTVVSARSGDTEDTWLADLGIGWGAGQIKVGSLMRSERTAKWNRLLYLEARLGERVRFAGRSGLPRGLV